MRVSPRRVVTDSDLSVRGPERLRRDLSASRQAVEELRRRVTELSDEVTAVYGAYDRTMAELRRCREGARDLAIKVELRSTVATSFASLFKFNFADAFRQTLPFGLVFSFHVSMIIL